MRKKAYGEFKIEKGVPIGRGSGQHQLYPLAEMSVGDSFLIGKHATAVRSAVRYHQLNVDTKARFTIRMTDDGYRCWRIA